MTQTIPQQLITTGKQGFVQFKETDCYYNSIGLTQSLNKQNSGAWNSSYFSTTAARKIHLENPILKDH